MQFPDHDQDAALETALAPAPVAAAAAEAAGTDIALLPPKARALLVLKSEKTEADLKMLVARSTHITEVKNADGREQAHRMAMDLRNARTTITNTGKAARDDANAFNKAVLDEEKRLLKITEAEETRVFKLRDDFDAQVKAQKAEAERKERERVEVIQSTIANIRALPVEMVNASADDLQTEIDGIEELTREGLTMLDEFAEEGLAAAKATRLTLQTMLTAATAREAMAAQLAAQQAQLEEQQRALAEAQAQLAAQRPKEGGWLAEQLKPEPAPGYVVPTDEREAPRPAGWDKIEGDTVITPELHEQLSRIDLGDEPARFIDTDETGTLTTGAEAPLTWETADERNLNEQINERQDAYTADDNQTAHGGTTGAFSEAGLARVAAAVATQSAPHELWVLLEDGSPVASLLTQDEIRAEAITACNLNPAYVYSIARYVLAEEE